MAQPTTRRRLSVADRRFLQACLGEAPVASADESQVYFSLAEADDEVDTACVQESMCGFFADADGEKNQNCHYDQLEDIYSFDLEKVTQALQNGATQQELSQAVELAMVEALERRLAAPAPLAEWLESKGLGKYASRIAELSDAETPEDLKLLDRSMLEDLIAAAGLKVVSAQKLRLAFKELCGETCEAGCNALLDDRVTGNLAGLMTPPTAPDSGRCTPQTTDGIPDAITSKDLARRLSTLRCSSALQRPLAGTIALRSDRDGQASDTAAAGECRRRCSSQQMPLQASGIAAAAHKSLAHSNGMRRKSLLKAADILESAGAGGAPEDLSEQLEKVQVAVEAASRRHRRSVAAALESAKQKRGEEEDCLDESLQHAQDQAALALHVDDRVQLIISTAYARHMYMMGE